MLQNRLLRRIVKVTGVKVSVLLCGMLMLLLAGILGGTYFFLSVVKQTAIDNQLLVNANLARAFQSYVAHLLQDVDSNLLLVKSTYERTGDAGEGLNGIAQHDKFQQAVLSDKMVVINENRKVAGAVNFSSPKLGIGLEDSFLFHQTAPDTAIYLSKPVMDEQSGAWELYLSRRLSHPDGSFAGIVACNVRIIYFTHFFRLMNLDEKYVVSLTGMDGVIRVRAENEQADASGFAVRATPLIDKARTKPEGSWYGISYYDGKPRLFSYRSIPEYSLLVLVGATEQATLGEYYRHVRYYTGCALLGSLMLIGSFCALWRMIYKRQQDMRLQRALFQISEAARTKQLEEFYAAIPAAVQGLMPLESAHIALYDDGKQELTEVYHCGREQAKPPRELLQNLGQSDRDKILWDEVGPPGKTGTDWLVVALKTNTEDILGVLLLQTGGRQPASPALRTLLDFIANQLAMAIQRQRQEETLQMQTKFTEAIMDSVPGMLYLYDADGKMVRWNKKHSLMTGYTDEEMADLSMADWFKDEAALAKINLAIRRALTEGFAEEEAELWRKDGTTIPMLFNAVRLYIDDQLYFTGVGLDTTKLKEAEKKLLEINQQLEYKVEERTQELTALNEELTAGNEEIMAMNEELLKTNELLQAEVQTRQQAEQELTETIGKLQAAQNYLIQSEKMAALGSLVAGVAHEINTPLGVGVTGASHLQELTRHFLAVCRDGSPSRRDMVEYLEDLEKTSSIILKNMERASSLIKSFKQVAVDQSHEELRCFSLRGYLNEVLTSMHPALKKTQHSVQLDCPDEIEVIGYPGALAQVMTNLIMNSLNHAYGSGEAGHISIKAEQRGSLVELTYADDGKGIPADILPKIFDPFFTTRRGSGGTGLGLFVVYTVVNRQLGGLITCESAVGQGTTFKIRFPLEKEEGR